MKKSNETKSISKALASFGLLYAIPFCTGFVIPDFESRMLIWLISALGMAPVAVKIYSYLSKENQREF